MDVRTSGSSRDTRIQSRVFRQISTTGIEIGLKAPDSREEKRSNDGDDDVYDPPTDNLEGNRPLHPLLVSPPCVFARRDIDMLLARSGAKGTPHTVSEPCQRCTRATTALRRHASDARRTARRRIDQGKATLFFPKGET